MINGGSISDSLDGGALQSEQPFGNGYYFALGNPTLLYSTGNLFLSAYSGYDAEISVGTGRYYRFFKANRDYALSPYRNVSNDTNLSGSLGFRLLPSENYKIYDNVNNIFYVTSPASTIRYSGINPAGEVTQSPDFPSAVSNVETWSCLENDNSEITASGNFLIVYNNSFQESIDIKNYYTGMRTGLVGANILGINCHPGHSGCTIDTGRYVREIRAPIHRHIMTGNKPIKYVLLLHGIPSFLTGSTNFNVGTSTPSTVYCHSTSYDLSVSLFVSSGYARPSQFTSSKPRAKFLEVGNIFSAEQPNIDRNFLFAEYSGNTALFCHLGTLQNRTDDLSGYIRTICSKGITSGMYLLGSGQNNTFLAYSNNSGFYPSQFSRDISFYSGLGINLFRSKPISDGTSTMTGMNVCGFTSDGWHGFTYTGGTGTNPVGVVNGLWESFPSLCRLTGYNWYLSSHYESYAGDLLTFEFDSNGTEMLPHSPFSRQIKPGAMGGSNYSNIPVGFVGSLTEPSYDGIEHIQFFDAWFNGRPFIEAAYMGLNFKSYAFFGDPFVMWK